MVKEFKFSPEDGEYYTDETFSSKNALRTYVTKLVKSGGSSTEANLYSFWALRKVCSKLIDFKKSDKVEKVNFDDFADILTELDFLNYISQLLSPENIPKLNENPFNSNIGNALVVIRNTVSSAPSYAEEFSKSLLLGAYIDVLGSDLFEASNLADKKSEHLRRIVNRTLKPLGDTLRQVPSTKSVFRQLKGIETVVQIMKVNKEPIPMHCLKIFAYAADLEKSVEILKASVKTTQGLAKERLEDALDSENHIGKEYGYTVEEIMQTLTLLARNEMTAKQMVDADVLKNTETVLERGKNDEEVLYALELIWNLSFVDEIKEKIIGTPSLLEDIERLKTNSEKTIARASAGAWMQLNPPEKKEQTESDEQHVMISYNWDHQPLALQLRDALRKDGFQVWMDVEQMEGDMLAKMAEAVEGSSVIVSLLSEAYRNSQACRSEIQYAYRIGKPIVFALVEEGFNAKSGWLAILMGTQLYYSLFANFEAVYDKLMHHVEDFADASEEKAAAKTQTAPTKPSAATWNHGKVIEWLKETFPEEEKLHAILPKKADGKFLKECHNWLKQDYPSFRTFAQNDLGIKDVVEQVWFCGAVRNLKF